VKLQTDRDDIYFVGDTHFGHNSMHLHWRMSPLTSERFQDKDTMTEWLVDEWNRTVPPDGIVFHLGDVSFLNSNDTAAVLYRLNGTIHLIEGNHDRRMSTINRDRFASIQPYLELTCKAGEPSTSAKQRIVLCHYAFRTWNNAHYGVWNLHGHSHNNLSRFGGQLDVGVDCNAIQNTYRPVTLEEVAVYMADNPYAAVDHHVGKDSDRKKDAGEGFG